MPKKACNIGVRRKVIKKEERVLISLVGNSVNMLVASPLSVSTGEEQEEK